MKTGELREILNDYESGLYNFCKDGECSECGNCCSRYLAMSQKEINTIKAYIKRKGIKQQKHARYVYRDNVFDSVCPFLDDNRPTHKCLIYEVRPLICREFRCDKWIKHEIPTNLIRSDLHPCDLVEIFFENN